MNSLSSAMGNVLVKSAVVDFGIQWACFAVAAAFKTEKFFDLAGSGTFLFLAYKSLQWGEAYFQRQKVQTGLVMIWAIRLGSYLVKRIMKDGKDVRFDEAKQQPLRFFVVWNLQVFGGLPGSIIVILPFFMKERLGLYLFTRILKDGHDRRFNQTRNDPTRFFIFWTIQAVWVFMTLLPVLILNGKRRDVPIGTRDYLGWGMWGVGFLLEAVADWQKSAFRANPDNAGKFITSGLWSISRHPNYLGEIMMWTGLFISSSSVMKGTELLSVLSPLFVTFLLTKVSGIPLLEKSAAKRWGQQPAFQEYVKNTAVLVPYLY